MPPQLQSKQVNTHVPQINEQTKHCLAVICYVLSQEVVEKRVKLGKIDERTLSWITAQTSAQAARKKRIFKASGVGEMLFVNG